MGVVCTCVRSYASAPTCPPPTRPPGGIPDHGGLPRLVTMSSTGHVIAIFPLGQSECSKFFGEEGKMASSSSHFKTLTPRHSLIKPFRIFIFWQIITINVT